MRAGAAVLEKLPTPLLIARRGDLRDRRQRDCDIKPLVAEFGIQLTPMREGLQYLRAR